MKNKIPQILVGLLILLFLSLFLFQRKTGPSVITEKPTLVATVASSTGDVSRTDAAKATTPVRIGDVVKTGDTFVTGKDGYISLEFYSGSRTALDANSRLKIEEASIDASNWKKQRVRLTLLAGRVWSRALQLLDREAGYNVGYNNVIAVVRGTAFLVAGEARDMVVHEFDGTIGFNEREGELTQGRSARIKTDDPKQDIRQTIHFTPDSVRNDPWIRQQLREDADFARRAAAVRQTYGVEETVSAIGNEAGPYTLDTPPAGVTIETTSSMTITIGGKTTNLGTVKTGHETYHNGYRGVLVTAKDQQAVISPGGTLAMLATAMFDDPNSPNTTRMEEVTDKATWLVLDESIASIDANGVLHAKPNASGQINVIARYNDGTHEHSNTFSVPVR